MKSRHFNDACSNQNFDIKPSLNTEDFNIGVAYPYPKETLSELIVRTQGLSQK